jgi:hypothetical protein
MLLDALRHQSMQSFAGNIPMLDPAMQAFAAPDPRLRRELAIRTERQRFADIPADSYHSCAKSKIIGGNPVFRGSNWKSQGAIRGSRGGYSSHSSG